MNLYSKRQRWKIIMLFFAMLITIVSLFVTNRLVDDLAFEERKKVELWAEGTKHLANLKKSPEEDLGFLFEIIQNNTTVPVILTDKSGNIISHRNIDDTRVSQPGYMEKMISKMRSAHDPIEIFLFDGDKNYIYYKDSIILTRLSYYPYIQLFIIAVFILIAYYALSATKQAEQNQVWVGMSKETAHQLGTPTSSLMAWVELLKEKEFEQDIVNELSKDVYRLEKITERFSKIGAEPNLKRQNIVPVLINAIHYIKARSSAKVKIDINFKDSDEIDIPFNSTLFEWVIENLCKNAINAMGGEGLLSFRLLDNTQYLYIDIMDTGKGIPKNLHKTVFQPGFTTRKRGWGLGLSLTKRIVESYHKGKIFVNQSEVGKGTTMRIVLRK